MIATVQTQQQQQRAFDAVAALPACSPSVRQYLITELGKESKHELNAARKESPAMSVSPVAKIPTPSFPHSFTRHTPISKQYSILMSICPFLPLFPSIYPPLSHTHTFSLPPIPTILQLLVSFIQIHAREYLVKVLTPMIMDVKALLSDTSRSSVDSVRSRGSSTSDVPQETIDSLGRRALDLLDVREDCVAIWFSIFSIFLFVIDRQNYVATALHVCG